MKKNLINKTIVGFLVVMTLLTAPGRATASASSSPYQIYISASAWAKPEIEKAYNNGLIPQRLLTTDSTKPATREELCELIMLLYERITGKTAEPASPNPFSDTSNAEILRAYKLGIITGTTTTTFSPNDIVTREQVATMFGRAIRVMFPNDDYSLSGAPVFSDQSDISSWALEHVQFMSKAGILNGTDGKFMPSPMTDAQKAVGYGVTKREAAVAIALRIFIRYDATDTSATPNRYYGWAPGRQGLAITPDGKTAYVSFNLDDALLRVDLPTMTVTGSVDVSKAGTQLFSESVLVTPDGSKVYVANSGYGNVMVIDANEMKIITVLPIKPSYVAMSMSKDGSEVYIPSQDGSLNVVNVADDSCTRINVPGIVFGTVCPSPQNPHIIYSAGAKWDNSGGKPCLYKVDLQTDIVLQIIAIPTDYETLNESSFRRLYISSDETTAYMGSFSLGKPNEGTGGMYVLDLAAKSLKTFQPVDMGVADFSVNESVHKAYIIGFRAGGDMFAKQSVKIFDMVENKVTGIIPFSSSSDQRAVVLDPIDPDILYMTEGDYNLIRKVRLSDGADLADTYFNKAIICPYAILPDGNTGFIVTQSDMYNIYKLDLFTGEPKGFIHISEPFSGWGVYKGKLYLGQGNDILIVDPDDGAIENKFSLGNQINPTLLFTFYDNKMALIDYLPGSMISKRLYVYDLDTRDLLKSVELPDTSCGHRALVSPDGTKLYVENGAINGIPTVITIYDSSTLDIIATITVPPADDHHYGATSFLEGDFDENKRILYLTGFTSVYMIDMDSNNYLGALNLIDYYEKRNITGWTPTGLCGVMLSPSRDKLMAVSGDAHSVYMYDFEKSEWTDVENIKGYFPTNTVFIPDSKYMYIVNRNSDSISMIDAETGKLKKILYLDEF